MELFKRNMTVQIGDGGAAINVPNTFKISFSIKKLISSATAEGMVTVFNLADQTKEFARERGKRIRVSAGYGDGDPPLLHDGDVLRVAQEDDQANRKTSVFFGGRIFSVKDAVFSKSYSGSISLRQIVLDALPTFSLTFAESAVNEIPGDITLDNFSFSGRTGDVLDQLLQPIGYQWFEKDSEILISKKGEITSAQSGDVFVLNSGTGLVKTAVQTDRGVNATCLLNAKLIVGGIVKIESDVVQNSSFNDYFVQKTPKNTEGFYKIIQTTHEGDNWDGTYRTMIQCVPYGGSQT